MLSDIEDFKKCPNVMDDNQPQPPQFPNWIESNIIKCRKHIGKLFEETCIVYLESSFL